MYGSSFTHLVGSKDSPFLDTYFSLTSGLVPGNYYNFKVKAMNAFGVSDFSEPVRVRAVSVPAAVSAVGFIQDYDQIRISWSAPDNHALLFSTTQFFLKMQLGVATLSRIVTAVLLS